MRDRHILMLRTHSHVENTFSCREHILDTFSYREHILDMLRTHSHIPAENTFSCRKNIPFHMSEKHSHIESNHLGLAFMYFLHVNWYGGVGIRQHLGGT